MKMRRTYKPELIACVDETRQHLFGCQLEPKRKRLIATNGHALVTIAVPR